MNANLFVSKNFNRLFVCAALACSLLVGGCAGNRYERSTGESIDDTATTMRVKNALGKDPVYKYPDVTVTTFKGTVQLSGFVDTQDQKSRASDIARNVEGVREVDNTIELKK
jgi:hyperosmotically inducible protein